MVHDSALLVHGRQRRDAEHPDVTRFILLSTQRSGTSWVMERLAAHPRIGSYGELLLANSDRWPDWPPRAEDRPFYNTYLREHGYRRTRVVKNRHLFEFLDYLYTPRSDYLAIGFKLMYNEALPLPGVLFYARSRRIRVIHLIRENLLDIALSQMGTAVRRSVHAWSIEEREDLKIRVDITNLRWWLRHLERERLAGRWILRILGLDVLEITYESLRASDMPLHDVLRFLEVPVPADGELPARMLKLAPDSHRDGIANFDEVEACLRGTRFARFLRG